LTELAKRLNVGRARSVAYWLSDGENRATKTATGTQKQLLLARHISGGLHHVHFKACVGLGAVAPTQFDADSFDS
jgi:hypothetical protein